MPRLVSLDGHGPVPLQSWAVTKGVRKLFAVLTLALLLAAGVSACGGDDSDSAGTSTTATTTATGDDSSAKAAGTAENAGNGSSAGGGGSGEQQSSGESGGSAGGSGGSGQSNDSDSSSPGVKAAPLRVSGGGSASFREPGGDNSIQDFGDESEESELEEAARVVHDFLVARAGEDWETACSYFSASMVKQLEHLASQSEQLKDEGCGAIFNALTTPVPPSARRAMTEVDAVSLRRDGERGFLLFHGPAGVDYFMPMVQEGGSWKVSSVAPSPFR